MGKCAIEQDSEPGGPLGWLCSVPLHVSILTIFVLLITVLVGIVVVYNHKKNSDVALRAAGRLMQEIGTSVSERTTRVFEPAFAIADEAVLLPRISRLPDVHGHPLAPLLLNTLDANPNIMSLYMGYANGDFFIISKYAVDDDASRATQGAPASASYAMQRVVSRRDGQRVRIIRFLDTERRTIGSKVVMGVDYDPRVRPWYAMAIDSGTSVLTDLYVYSWSREVGLTVARRFDGLCEGVFGADIAMSGVSRFLRGQKVGAGSHLFMFRKDGQLMAYSEVERTVKEINVGGQPVVAAATIADLGDPAMSAFYRVFEDAGRAPFPRRLLKAGDKRYLASVTAVRGRYGKDHYLGIVVPLDEFTGAITKAGRESLLVSLAALIAFMPLVVLVSRRLSRPIRQLAGEADKIRRFELEGEMPVSSRISEIRNLTRAMGTMKSTLASFSQYVPKALVERMVKLNIVPRLGGERRELTLFFTDISDFTSISEAMPAEDLAHMISSYFERMGSVILGQGGTIDKFIGDAIMAFWNAPEPVADHAARACLAALRCQEQSRRFNAALVERGASALHTRIGLHTGEAVVGNIGSTDRMDYTAMGAPVNMASRLEGLNKYYGTWILASLTLKEGAGDGFLFRTVGRVVPKGASAPMAIFELRGVRGDLAGEFPDLAVTPEDEERCAQWERACERYYGREFEEATRDFEAILDEHGPDPVCDIFLERALLHRAEPPGDDWDGVEVFHVK